MGKTLRGLVTFLCTFLRTESAHSEGPGQQSDEPPRFPRSYRVERLSGITTGALVSMSVAQRRALKRTTGGQSLIAISEWVEV